MIKQLRRRPIEPTDKLTATGAWVGSPRGGLEDEMVLGAKRGRDDDLVAGGHKETTGHCPVFDESGLSHSTAVQAVRYNKVSFIYIFIHHYGSR